LRKNKQKFCISFAMRRNYFSFIHLLFCVSAYAQQVSEGEKHHEHAVGAGYIQVKEGLNYGLVFRGAGVLYQGNWFYTIGENRLSYDVKFNFSYFTAREIDGAAIGLQPVHFAYDLDIGKKKKLFIGAALHIDYNYALYPDLQSGFSFWFTNYSLGAGIDYKFHVKRQVFRIKGFTTIAGFSSRPPVYRNPYFFELSAGNAIKYLHDDLEFGSFNAYNQSNFEIRWQPRELSRLAAAYALDYYGYHDAPRFTMLNQYLKLIIYPRQQKK
jgi:hypothetical protein